METEAHDKGNNKFINQTFFSKVKTSFTAFPPVTAEQDILFQHILDLIMSEQLRQKTSHVASP